MTGARLPIGFQYDDILQALAGRGWMSSAQIARALGKSANDIRTRMPTALADGAVEQSWKQSTYIWRIRQ